MKYSCITIFYKKEVKKIVNDTSKSIFITNNQYDSIMQLEDEFRSFVQNLILQSEGVLVVFDDFDIKLEDTHNNIIVSFRFVYHGYIYLLLALVRKDGKIFTLDKSIPGKPFDYIFIID